MFNGEMNKCAHFSCDDCFQEFFKTMIDNNMLSKIQCPEVGCGIKAHDQWVEKMLKKSVDDVKKFNRLKNNLKVA
jgi:hypothetical protein